MFARTPSEAHVANAARDGHGQPGQPARECSRPRAHHSRRGSTFIRYVHARSFVGDAERDSRNGRPLGRRAGVRYKILASFELCAMSPGSLHLAKLAVVASVVLPLMGPGSAWAKGEAPGFTVAPAPSWTLGEGHEPASADVTG